MQQLLAASSLLEFLVERLGWEAAGTTPPPSLFDISFLILSSEPALASRGSGQVSELIFWLVVTFVVGCSFIISTLNWFVG